MVVVVVAVAVADVIVAMVVVVGVAVVIDLVPSSPGRLFFLLLASPPENTVTSR